MNERKLRPWTAIAASLALAWISGSARAEYPDRPIKLVVPYATAGVADILARGLGEALRAELGHTVLIENRPGGNTQLAARVVVNAPADGYTLMLSSSASMVLNPLLFKSVGYDVSKDFRQLAVLATVPFLIVTNFQTKAQTLKQFAAAAKDSKGAWNYASPGVGNPLHIATETLKGELGIEMTHVPYSGSAPSLTSLIANDTQMMIDIITSSAPMVKGGKLQALALVGDKRSPLLPDVPTTAESGFPGIRSSTWFGLAVPAGVPAPVFARLQEAVKKASASPAFVKWAETQGLMMQPYRSEAEVLQYIVADRDAWQKTIVAKKISLD